MWIHCVTRLIDADCTQYKLKKISATSKAAVVTSISLPTPKSDEEERVVPGSAERKEGEEKNGGTVKKGRMGMEMYRINEKLIAASDEEGGSKKEVI